MCVCVFLLELSLFQMRSLYNHAKEANGKDREREVRGSVCVCLLPIWDIFLALAKTQMLKSQ